MVVSVIALGMVAQVRGPVHALHVVEYIRGSVIYLLELPSGVGRLDILLELVLIPGISLSMLMDLCL